MINKLYVFIVVSYLMRKSTLNPSVMSILFQKVLEVLMYFQMLYVPVVEHLPVIRTRLEQ